MRQMTEDPLGRIIELHLRKLVRVLFREDHVNQTLRLRSSDCIITVEMMDRLISDVIRHG